MQDLLRCGTSSARARLSFFAHVDLLTAEAMLPSQWGVKYGGLFNHAFNHALEVARKFMAHQYAAMIATHQTAPVSKRRLS